jgi:hypothetical protein
MTWGLILLLSIIQPNDMALIIGTYRTQEECLRNRCDGSYRCVELEEKEK